MRELFLEFERVLENSKKRNLLILRFIERKLRSQRKIDNGKKIKRIKLYEYQAVQIVGSSKRNE